MTWTFLFFNTLSWKYFLVNFGTNKVGESDSDICQVCSVKIRKNQWNSLVNVENDCTKYALVWVMNNWLTWNLWWWWKFYIKMSQNKSDVNCLSNLHELLNNKEMVLQGVVKSLNIIAGKYKMLERENNKMNEKMEILVKKITIKEIVNQMEKEYDKNIKHEQEHCWCKINSEKLIVLRKLN